MKQRKAFVGSKPTSNFLPCGSRWPLTTKRRPTIALLSKLRRPLNVIHGNDRFIKFNRARGNYKELGDICFNVVGEPAPRLDGRRFYQIMARNRAEQCAQKRERK